MLAQAKILLLKSWPIAKVIGYEGGIEFDPTTPDGTPEKLMDSTRLNNLGWGARVSLEEGLRLAYSDFLKNQDSYRQEFLLSTE